MNTKTKQNVNVGVDTGKFQLDIYIRPLDIYFTVNNDEKGIKEAVKTIKKYSPHRIVIEATGRLEMPFVIANPIHVKRFAGALGQRAKTDKLDAQLIAHYGEVIQPNLSELKPETMQPMSDLVARRNQLLVMQTMEKNRLQIDNHDLPWCLRLLSAWLKIIQPFFQKFFANIARYAHFF